jgi:hypothetical protein
MLAGESAGLRAGEGGAYLFWVEATLAKHLKTTYRQRYSCVYILSARYLIIVLPRVKNHSSCSEQKRHGMKASLFVFGIQR